MARRRELLQRVGIDLVLEVEAALEFAALARQLLRVGHDLLRLGSAGGDTLEVGQPCGAAQLAAAGAQTAHLAGLLTDADLLHLDAHMELLGQHLDELAEVHTLVGGIVEDGLRVVALELHVVHLHVQPHVEHDAAGAQQGAVLFAQGTRPALDVVLFGAAEHLFDCLRVGVDAVLPHLQATQFAGEVHDAHVVSGLSFHGHHVALGHLQPVGQAVEVFVVVLEAHLHTVERALGGLSDAAQPVGGRHLRAALPFDGAHRHVALGALVATPVQVHRLLVFHPRYLGVGVQVGIQGVLLAHILLHLGVLPFHRGLLLGARLAALAHKCLYIFRRSDGLLTVEDRLLRLLLQFVILAFFHFYLLLFTDALTR